MQVTGRFRRTLVVIAALAVCSPVLVAGPQARAADPGVDPHDPGVVGELPADLTYHLSPQLAAALGTDTLDEAGARAVLSRRGASGPVAQPTPAVGAVRQWPALDDTGDTGIPVVGIYLKQYTLLAKGPKIEVWVASGSDDKSSGTQFPAGDCRATKADPTVVTAAQAQQLVNEFTNRMLPVESKLFSIAPSEDGTLSLGQLPALGVDFRGDGDSTVTLVDNVRDPNFYDFAHNRTYIAGFFAPIFNQLTNRNVMTIDAFDWAHRTGDQPADAPSKDICQSRPARPRLYEATFAHEYQHLLESYQDEQEKTWVNEGLSDMAEALVGYAHPSLSVHQARAEAHIYCFQGYGLVKGPSNPNPIPCGGPENSLTVWNDEGSNSEVLADYGNAWSFMLYLYDHYGAAFISALHRDGQRQGLDSVQGLLDSYDPGKKVLDLLHDYQLMTLLDHLVSAKGAKLVGADRRAVTTRSLDASVDLKAASAYALPGAAPNGADYVALRDGTTFLPGAALRSLSFTGARTLPAQSFQPGPSVQGWTVRLVGVDAKAHRAMVATYQGFELTLGAADLKAFASYPQVVAVVTQDDGQELVDGYALYQLTVNGSTQPG
ncbi:MAG TPA: hypothetical protein VGJ14_01980 [Sporichthyaceae bacterium]|jgi:hypothetical protein